jgi:hypothetical protein
VPGWAGTSVEASAPLFGTTRPWALISTKKHMIATRTGASNQIALTSITTPTKASTSAPNPASP